MGLIGEIPGFGWTAALQGTPLFIFFTIFTLVILFLFVAGRSLIVAWELGKITQEVRTQGRQARLLKIFAFETKAPYKHLWSEYKDTLHHLKRKDEAMEYRATLPAEAFFSKETLVDNRILVWNDFFRHLPGILTGLGIIGTFAGLITGLEGFTPSEDAGSARTSLSVLLHGVKEAFHLSAFAITCAIVVTFLEKSSLTWAYKNVENLTHAIDTLYDAGAGEEYLARLVEADEANTAQTAQLKDALVNDLRTLLGELTERQIEAQKTSSIELGHVIRGSLGEVTSSLSDLHNTFSGKASTDTDNMKGALDSLMAAFIDRINTTLGDQMQAIQSSMQQSTQTMQQVEQSLNGLVSNIAKTTSGVMEDVMSKMEDTMQKAASNQEQMTRQMGEFVNQLRTQMETQQTASHETMQKMLAELLQTVQHNQVQTNDALNNNINELLIKFNESVSKTNEIQATQSQQLTNNVESVITQVNNATISVQDNISKLHQTTDAIINNTNKNLEENRQQTIANQEKMAQKMSEFFEKTHLSIQNQQTYSQQNMQALLEKMLHSINSNQDQTNEKLNSNINQLIANLHENLSEMSKAQDTRQQQLAVNMERLIKEISNSMFIMQNNITELRRTTTDAISGMNSGADRMKAAADHFSTAGQSVSGVLEKTTPIATQMASATNILGQASQQLTNSLAQHQQIRNETARHIETLQQLINTAKQEAGIKQELVDQLHEVAEILESSSIEVSSYLDKVNGVLDISFTKFGQGMSQQVESYVKEANSNIAQATNLLSGVCQQQLQLVRQISKAK